MSLKTGDKDGGGEDEEENRWGKVKGARERKAVENKNGLQRWSTESMEQLWLVKAGGEAKHIDHSPINSLWDFMQVPPTPTLPAPQFSYLPEMLQMTPLLGQSEK